MAKLIQMSKTVVTTVPVSYFLLELNEEEVSVLKQFLEVSEMGAWRQNNTQIYSICRALQDFR